MKKLCFILLTVFCFGDAASAGENTGESLSDFYKRKEARHEQVRAWDRERFQFRVTIEPSTSPSAYTVFSWLGVECEGATKEVSLPEFSTYDDRKFKSVAFNTKASGWTFEYSKADILSVLAGDLIFNDEREPFGQCMVEHHCENGDYTVILRLHRKNLAPSTATIVSIPLGKLESGLKPAEHELTDGTGIAIIEIEKKELPK